MNRWKSIALVAISFNVGVVYATACSDAGKDGDSDGSSGDGDGGDDGDDGDELPDFDALADEENSACEEMMDVGCECCEESHAAGGGVSCENWYYCPEYELYDEPLYSCDATAAELEDLYLDGIERGPDCAMAWTTWSANLYSCVAQGFESLDCSTLDSEAKSLPISYANDVYGPCYDMVNDTKFAACN